MANTLSSTVAWSQAFMQYIPLTAAANSDPALQIANMVVSFMLNSPFTWAFNRAEDTSLSTVAGTQDYTLSISSFGFLEKATLTDPSGNSVEVKDVYNTRALGVTSTQSRPNAISVKLWTPGTSIGVRLMPNPDKIYTGTLTYQKAPVAFTSTSQGWLSQTGIPDSYSDIYNNLFLAEAFQVADDARAAQYRQRGMAALLAKSEGLSEMEKSIIFEQSIHRDLQQVAAQLRTQQAQTARGI